MLDLLSEGLKDLKGFPPIELIARVETKVDLLILAVERVEKLLIYYKPVIDVLRKLPFVKS